MPNLTPLITHTPNSQPLFATVGQSGPGGDPTIDTGFIANGAGSTSGFKTTNPLSNNVVLMSEDTVGNGKAFVTVTDNSGVNRWVMATTSTESAGNVGSDLAILSYDNSGNLLDTPFVIQRSTGYVGIQKNLFVDGSGLTVDGSNVMISKTSLAYTGNFGPYTSDFSGSFVLGSVTIPVSGVYILSSSLGINVDATNGATVGTSDNVLLEITSGASGIANSLRPFTMPNTASAGVDYGVNTTNIGVLSAGAYDVKIVYNNVSGTMAFPGGLSANYYIVGLCN